MFPRVMDLEMAHGFLQGQGFERGVEVVRLGGWEEEQPMELGEEPDEARTPLPELMPG